MVLSIALPFYFFLFLCCFPFWFFVFICYGNIYLFKSSSRCILFSFQLLSEFFSQSLLLFVLASSCLPCHLIPYSPFSPLQTMSSITAVTLAFLVANILLLAKTYLSTKDLEDAHSHSTKIQMLLVEKQDMLRESRRLLLESNCLLMQNQKELGERQRMLLEVQRMIHQCRKAEEENRKSCHGGNDCTGGNLLDGEHEEHVAKTE